MAPALDEPMLPAPFTVRRARREIPGTVTLELEPEGGAAPVCFAAGQFNMLYAFGVGEAAFSISGDPSRPGPLLHTVRAVGKVSEALCALRRGEAVGVRGPFGAPWPMVEAEGSDVLLVAGGLGLAPLRPALYQLLSRRGRYGRIALCYGARTPRDVLYERELRGWRGALQVEVTVDSAAAGWQGSVGVVTALLDRARFDPAHTVALICGPEIMMHISVRALLQRGLPAGRIHLSMERSMKCALGFCGHCLLGPAFVCKDGPVMCYERLAPLLKVREL